LIPQPRVDLTVSVIIGQNYFFVKKKVLIDKGILGSLPLKKSLGCVRLTAKEESTMVLLITSKTQLARQLMGQGWPIRVAANCQIAANVIAEVQPELVVLDHKPVKRSGGGESPMPGLDVLEQTGVPVVSLLRAPSQTVVRTQIDYVVCPCAVDELVRTISYQLGKIKRKRERQAQEAAAVQA